MGFLDWGRGFAAVTMLQGHAFHSFTRPELRGDSVYVLSQFLGGMPPAIFLFLTGITYAFLMDSVERKGLPLRGRWMAALRRAGFLLGVAYLYRLQLWAFGQPVSPWTDLLKVDILNCMGLAMLVLSFLVLFSTEERIRIGTATGVAIAALSPLVSALDWSAAPALLRMYLKPDYNYFSFFPWASFVPFGVAAGSILRLTPGDRLEKAVQWGTLAGFGLILSGQYFGNLPYSIYGKSDFWLDSPALIFIKTGVVLLLLSVAYLWTEYGPRSQVPWMMLLGTHSLFVYWVHTEIVYGRWFWMWKENLSVAGAGAMAAGVVVLMILLTWLKQRRWPSGPLIAKKPVPHPTGG